MNRRRKLVPIALGTVALILGAASAAMAPPVLPASTSQCEEDARCAPLDPSEWCTEELHDTICEYWPDQAHPNDPEQGICNTWTTGFCPFT